MSKKLVCDKLEIGAGDARNPDAGWLYQDIEALPGIDVVCDFLKIDEFVEEGSVKYLKAVHCLEHIGTSDVAPLFEKLYKIMGKGSRILIRVPNLQFHAQLLSEGRDEEAVTYCFGGQLDQWDFHKTGYTPKILKRHLENAGFSAVQIQPETEIIASAYKE